MPYLIVDIEVTEPLQSILVPDGYSGAAILMRYRTRPVHFYFEESVGASEISRESLSQVVSGLTAACAALDRDATDAAVETILPTTTLVVCTRERPEYLQDCLRSLTEQRARSAHRFAALEILVVDNAPSGTRTREVVASFDDVAYVLEENRGLNFARKKAVEACATELIVFVDDDVVVDKYWLDGLCESFIANPEAAAFTGQVLPYELATEPQVMFEKRGGFRKGFAKTIFDESYDGGRFFPYSVGIIGTGANMAFRRNILQEIGGFDVTLDIGPRITGGGDVDIFNRLLRANHRIVYEPAFMVFHKHRRTFAELHEQLKSSWGTGYMAYLVKSYRRDVSHRRIVRRYIAWWFLHDLWHLAKSLIGRHALRPKLLIAELYGGLRGVMIGYGL